MKFAKWIEPTDKKKTPEEILLNAVLDVGAGFEEPVPCEKIWKVVSEWYGIDWTYLTGIYKKVGLKKERRICMYLMYQCSKLSFEEIAEEMGVKNGMKVLREINELDSAMRKNEKLRNEVLEIIEVLRQGVKLKKFEFLNSTECCTSVAEAADKKVLSKCAANL